MVFSETWGPPYDPHSYASSWFVANEAHFSAMKNLESPLTLAGLKDKITKVQLESNIGVRESLWAEIHNDVHQQAINLPLWGKRIPAVLSRRLENFVPGEQQFDYPIHKVRVVSGSKTVTIAPGAQTGLFKTVGRLDPHSYRPNEFFANNWVYESLVSYGRDGMIEPALATSWEISEKSGGGQIFTFTLRDNVFFHDGSSWNCSVAKLNFDHVLAAPLTSDDYHRWYNLPKYVSSWTCSNDGKFILETSNSYYPLLQELSYIRPIRFLAASSFQNGLFTSPVTHNSCPIGWGSVTGKGTTITCAGIKSPVGTGPFKFISRTADSAGDAEVVFERHLAYWGGSPDIQQLVVKRYSSQADVRNALLTGQLDIAIGVGPLLASDIQDF
jgi:ABC-type transport system substrate-binding protein